VGREPATNPGGQGGATQLAADPRGGAWPAAGRAAQHAEQRADGQGRAELQPGIEMVPGPTVHPDLAPPAAFPGANEDRAALSVKVGLGQRERFADPQPGAPQHDDHAA
jgi:hypothetical protein